VERQTAGVVETKLHAPPIRRTLVKRPRLTEVLRRSTGSRLTIVSAPPGFGKTSLISDWLHGPGHDCLMAWLSLDEADADPATYWPDLIASLDRAAPGVGASALRLLPTTSNEVALTALINDLARLPRDVVLVLDDYHAADGPQVQAGMTFLLDHLPENVHLVIATRADPALPLARLRARGDLTEIRAADLRFSASEAAAYLKDAMGLSLSPDLVAALERRTEGWIAALQLAALSMQGRDDVSGFVASFAGGHRYVLDYLADEVLHRQSADVRKFLLETSVLGRLTAPLCDAVTGRGGGKAMLERLEHDNLFVVPLDDRREWYRYHQLFADVLGARLLEEDPATVPVLHRRASDWFEEHGDRPEAIRHTLAGEAFNRAGQLIELATPELNRARAEMTLRRWLEALPDSVIRCRPILAATFASVLMQTGEFARVDDLLATAAAAIEPGAGPPTVEDKAALISLPGNLAVLHAAYARLTGDLPRTISEAERALDLAPDDDHLTRGGAASVIGLARWETGELDAAYRSYASGMASLEGGGYQSDVVGGQVTLADIRIAQGRLGDALDAYRRGLKLAVGGAGPALRGAADMHVGMSDVLRERDDLAGAREHLAASRELGDENGLPKNPYRWRLADARIRYAEGDLSSALELLDAAELVFFADFSPVVASIPAVRARFQVAQGRLAAARAWADGAGVDATDEATYVGQFGLATLARILLAEGRVDESVALAERLVTPARTQGWIGAAIDGLIVHALGSHARGDRSSALDSLGTAFDYAEPEGYIRTFVDEGPPMAALLRAAASHGLAPGYVSLLEASLTSTGRIRRQPLVEPLSEREIEVLRLLATELSGPEIADRLVVSLHTVRSHTKAIFAKLGVNSRRAAVRRAAELDLLTGR
jgi:LuxR family transcriptional regulator, maltose regulon positive regulatory protein